MSVIAPTLAGSLRGELLDPQDAGYEDARRLYNAMIDKRPALIARCVDVADVVAAVRLRHASRGSRIAVPSAGVTTAAAWAACDGGLVIDLSLMNGVSRRPGGEAGTGRQAARTLGRGRPRNPCLRTGRPRPASSPPPASAA